MNHDHKLFVYLRLSSRKLSFALLFCMLMLQGLILSATPAQDSVAAAASRNTAMQDSITKAKADAAENEENQHKEKMNTILEVVGSVVAILGLVVLTWKFSSGPGKQRKPEKPQNSSTDGIRHGGVRR
jgi:hypothetical protein